MTREELFRAVGEVREDQIEAAGVMKKQVRPWRRFGALAACLALVVTAAAVPLASRGQPNWTHLIYSFNPGAERGNAEGSADSGGTGNLDGSDYWTDGPNRPTHPDYSTGVEIGELSGPGNNPGMMGISSCMAWLSPEEIFAQDTVIFRGTVREVQYYSVQLEFLQDIPAYYTRAIVEVTDSFRGGLREGETYSLLWLGARGYMTTSLTGPLEDLDVGGEAIFMPIWTGRDTGWKEGSSYFCYADLAELYLGEGQRYVFADTAEGLALDRTVYPALAEAETLDEAAAYIREKVGEEEQPAVSQTEPSEGPARTENAGSRTAAPAAPRETPGGAFIGDES